jgi:hypothetical protein
MVIENQNILINKVSVLALALWITVFLLIPLRNSAQEKLNIVWMNPGNNASKMIQGRAWNNDDFEGTYDRLPLRAKSLVRKPVWELSNHSAGINIRFRTDAKKIYVRYTLRHALSMPHMPATGVSGLDLYVRDSNKQWSWVKGDYSFSDTVRWTYSNLDITKPNQIGELKYSLFLPLYNSVKWLEIGVERQESLSFVANSGQKPLVVYGTSIAQGACASRPGMAWASILERRMDCPVVNLGFSGNGTLDREFVDLMSEIDALAYIFDCMPNLTSAAWTTKDETDLLDKITYAVETIRSKFLDTPILFTEHAGFSDRSATRELMIAHVNQTLREAFASLKSKGIKKIFLLTREEIGLDMDGTVDGIHPSDQGMVQYADAYARKIRKILN